MSSSSPQTQANTDDNLAIQNAIADINTEFKEREIQSKARELGMPYIDLSILPLNDDLLRIISHQESEDGQIIPFFQVGRKLRIAIVDPENTDTKQIIKNLETQGFTLNINLCSVRSLEKAQSRYAKIKTKDTSVEELQNTLLARANNIAEEMGDIANMPKKFEDIKSDLALAILNRKAIATNASDLHFETIPKGVRVRGRIDGTLRTFFTLSHEISKGIIRQIKFNSKIASNIKGIPADGQYSFPLEERTIQVRVSVLPEKDGESIVMRYLDPSRQDLDLDKLGFTEHQKKQISTMLSYREGLIVTTGPTGSGKTTTLYSMIKKINTPEKKIITLEDPVEYELDGIVQSSIDVHHGYTFESGLKTALRQDPDIILLGEIRDHTTAETALQASITGHLVLSTLHTNSALETLTRFKDLDIPDYLIASALRGVLAQRLARKICPHCSIKQPLTDHQRTQLQNILDPFLDDKTLLEKLPKEFNTGKGCVKCGNTGYKGRIVISETLTVSSVLTKMISEGSRIEEIKKYLIESKHKPLSYDAAIKIVKGETDFNEIVRVLGKAFLPLDF